MITLKDIVQRTNLVALVESHGTPLKKANGYEHSGCCPFHDEKHPSFSVNSQKGVYHCFSCGAHGNAYSFVQNRLGYTETHEVAKYLMKFNGILEDVDFSDYSDSLPIPVYTPRPQSLVKNTWLDKTHELFASAEINNHTYLEKKGLTEFASLFKTVSTEFYGIESNWLLIPLTDIDGKIQAFQAISNDGKKRFIGSIKGLFFKIGNENATEIILCEGIATGLSLLAGNPNRLIYCLLSTGGFKNVTAIAELHNKPVVIAADNDVDSEKPGKGNPGVFAAVQAKGILKRDKFDCTITVPSSQFKTDWNDWFLKNGVISDDVIKANTIEGLSLDVPKKLTDLVGFATQLKTFLPNSSTKLKEIGQTIAQKFVFDLVTTKQIQSVYPQLANEIRLAKEVIRGRSTNVQKRFKVEPTSTFNSGYIPSDFNFEHGTVDHVNVYLLKSPIGSGKTTLIKKFVESGHNATIIVPRQTLAKAIASVMEFSCYLDYETVEKYRQADNLVICINSVCHLQNDRRDVVILDESEQTLKQITSNLIDDKKAVINGLDSLLSTANTIILADADLSKISFNFIDRAMKRLNREYNLISIENTFKRFEGRTCFVHNDKHEMIDFIVSEAARGQKIYVATNTKTASKTLTKALREKTKNLVIKTINSENSGNEETAKILSNINEEIQSIDVLICSPSVTSGVSINDTQRHFDLVCGMFSAKGDTPGAIDCRQQIGRVRYAQNIHVWLDSSINTDLPTDKATFVNQWLDKGKYLNYATDTTFLLHPYYELYCDANILGNTFKRNLSESFQGLMVSDGWHIEGFTVTDTESKKRGQEINKTARESVKKEDNENLTNARVLTEKEFAKLDMSRESLSVDDQYAIEKFKIKEFFGDSTPASIELHQHGIKRAVIAQEISKADTAILKEIDAIRVEKAIEKWTETELTSMRLTQDLVQRIELAYGTGNVTQDSQSIQDFCKWLIKNESLLNGCKIVFSARKLQSAPMKTIGELAARYGFKTIRDLKQENGKRGFVYSIKLNEDVSNTLARRKEIGKNMPNDLYRRIAVFPTCAETRFQKDSIHQSLIDVPRTLCVSRKEVCEWLDTEYANNCDEGDNFSTAWIKSIATVLGMSLDIPEPIIHSGRHVDKELRV